MDEATIKKEYFAWLCSLVRAEPEYSMLWQKLHDMDFVWIVDRDENRAEDGKYLRYIFTIDTLNEAEVEEIDQILSGPCSVLEFLVGLARRIEDDIMESVDLENRTYRWFHEMVGNLGLLKYDNKHYSDGEIDAIVHRFMSRKYSKNGHGNIFWVGHFSGPLFSSLEIWSQMQAYFLENYGI